MPLPDWFGSSPPAVWLQALGTPIIGLAAAYIAYQSAQTAKKKLKFDMFEKRLEVYRLVAEEFRRAAEQGVFSMEQIRHLGGLRAQAKFLYANARIDSLLKKAEEHAAELFWPGPPAKYDEFGRKPSAEFDQLAHTRALALSHYAITQKRGPLPGLMAVTPERELWMASALWFGDKISRWDDLTLPYLKVFH
ncbi:hypothetical protein [Achromobacter xylosoxidans]|uniref:hypothetical protein n=1 Tax=Alcaligenes xylosoxydans xylosoxydans TaxID=85698 RepID=UPI0010418BF5|nr:hypothetical protein [Achromobacter xylosoxidans]